MQQNIRKKKKLFSTILGQGAPTMQETVQLTNATTYLYRSTRVHLVGNANV